MTEQMHHIASDTPLRSEQIHDGDSNAEHQTREGLVVEQPLDADSFIARAEELGIPEEDLREAAKEYAEQSVEDVEAMLADSGVVEAMAGVPDPAGIDIEPGSEPASMADKLDDIEQRLDAMAANLDSLGEGLANIAEQMEKLAKMLEKMIELIAIFVQKHQEWEVAETEEDKARINHEWEQECARIVAEVDQLLSGSI